MPSAIQTIFREVAPYLVARDLGIPIHEKGSLTFVDHPKIDKAVLWMSHGEFISSDPDDPFLAGDIFDFLTLHLGSYDAAVDFVIDHYRLLAVAGSGGKLDTHRHQYIGDLKHARAVFQRLIGLQTNMLNTSRYAAAFSWLTARRIQPKLVMRAIMVATGTDILAIVNASQCTPTPRASSIYIVYPYFNKYHSIAKLVLVPVDGGREVTVKLDTVRHCYFGLHTIRPNLLDTFVFKNADTALQYLAQGREFGNHAFGVIHPSFGGGSVGTSLKLPFGTFVMDRSCELANIAQMRNAFDEYTVAQNDNNHLQPQSPKKVNWLDFTARHFQSMWLEDRHLSPRMERFLEGVRCDPEVGRHIVKWLTDAKQPKMAEQVKKHTMRAHVIRIGDGDLEAHSTGYFFHKDGSSIPRQLTNFTLSMHRSVWFSENDAYYYGSMLAGGTEVPFKISEKELQSANKLKIILTAATKSTSEGMNNFQPIFYDHAAERQVIIGLKEQLRNFLGMTGIKQLGWNTSRTFFNTPVWRADIAQLDTSPRPPHPGSSVLNTHYSFDAFDFSSTYERVSPQVCFYLALLASMSARLYLKLPFPLVALRRTSASQNLLRYMFLAFNQLSPIELNVNKRQTVTLVPEEIANLPIYGNCTDPAGLTSQSGYIFALGANGESFTEEIDAQTSLQILGMTYQIQTQLVIWLLRNTMPDGMLAINPTTQADYVNEGLRLIQQATQFKDFTIPPLDTPALSQLLASLTVGELTKHCRRNAEGLAELSFRNLEQHIRGNVLIDLVKLNVKANFHKTNTRVIQIDAEQFEAVLQKFYGVPVTIPGPTLTLA